MIVEGYVKLFRSINTWQWYDDPNTKSLFLHLIVNANYKDGFFKGIPIKRGQIFVGRMELAKELGMSERSVRTSITKLKSTNEIATESTSRGTLITVINYEKFQVDYDESTNKATIELANGRPTNDQQTTNDRPQRKKDKKDNKRRNKEINTYSDLISSYTSNLDLQTSLNSYVEMRKKEKSYTTHALELALKHLNGLASDDSTKIEIVNQSIMKGWKDFYELKSNKKTYRRVESIPSYKSVEVPTVDMNSINQKLEELKKKRVM